MCAVLRCPSLPNLHARIAYREPRIRIRARQLQPRRLHQGGRERQGTATFLCIALEWRTALPLSHSPVETALLPLNPPPLHLCLLYTCVYICLCIPPSPPFFIPSPFPTLSLLFAPPSLFFVPLPTSPLLYLLPFPFQTLPPFPVSFLSQCRCGVEIDREKREKRGEGGRGRRDRKKRGEGREGRRDTKGGGGGEVEEEEEEVSGLVLTAPVWFGWNIY